MVMNHRPPPPLPSYEYITKQIQDMQRLHEDWLVKLESGLSPDDPRYVSPMHMNEEGRKQAGEVARKMREEKEAEEARNMEMWGRKDDPRLDPTSEFFDPLKLIHKDSNEEHP